MNIVIGAYQVGTDCIDYKNKIVDYLKNTLLRDTQVSIHDLSPIFIEIEDPSLDMRKAAEQVIKDKSYKGILVCRRARSASIAAKEAGIKDIELSIQDTTPLDKIASSKILALGCLFDWENTKKHLDAFFQ